MNNLKISKKLFCILLCFLTLLSLSVFGQTTPGRTNPVYGKTTSDPVVYLYPHLYSDYHRWFKKITDSPDQLIQFKDGSDLIHNLYWTNKARHIYSKNQPWNADQTLLHIQNRYANGEVKNLYLDANHGSDTYKVMFEKSRPCYESDGNGEERWDPVDPDLRVYVGQNKASCSPSKPNTAKLVIGKWNVRTNQETILEEFDPKYTKLQIGPWEGNLSNDGNWIAIVGVRTEEVDDPNDPTKKITTTHHVVFAYDLKNKQKGDDYILDALYFGKAHLDWASISPKGTYIVINGCWDTDDNCENGKPTGKKDANGNEIKVRVDDTTLVIERNGKPVSWWDEHGRPSHYDLAVDNNDEEVAVGVSNYSVEDGKVIKRRLSDGKVTVLTEINRNPDNKGYASHTSTRNLKRPGWAYVSYSNVSSWTLYQDEIVAVKLDGSGTVERWIKMNQIVSNDDHYQAQAVPSPDGERVIWACCARSGWTDNEPPTDQIISTYLVEH